VFASPADAAYPSACNGFSNKFAQQSALKAEKNLESLLPLLPPVKYQHKL
jgi:hypothetical protein